MITLLPASPVPLHARLRQATAGAHSQLEDALALLRPPLRLERFVQVLAGFHGFHAGWEPALAARLQAPVFTSQRQRLHCIAHDLLQLGLPAAQLAALPVCGAAAGLCDSTDAALGALYVVEGSTLGGKIIGRRLLQAAWCPDGGLRYFDAHGAGTGLLWRQTLAFIDSQAHDPQQVISGALQAFGLLRHWLADQGADEASMAALSGHVARPGFRADMAQQVAA